VENGFALFLRDWLHELKGNCMKKRDTKNQLLLRKRPTEPVAIEIPQDTLQSLKYVARRRDMSVQALLKFYIGCGLRQDLSRFFAERVLDTTAAVLARHIQSTDEVSAILTEIKGGVDAPDRADHLQAKDNTTVELPVDHYYHHPAWAYEVAETKTTDKDEALA
jgi:hypothetical protein